VADWDSDGQKDLLVGEADGYIRIYINTGTDDNPLFDGYFRLQVKESDFESNRYSAPLVIDWNNDGKKDVLSGEYYGKVHLLINSGSNENPLFTGSSLIMDGASELKAGHNSNPAVTDWNGDGKKDLLVGNADGTVYYYENRGTDSAPQFDGSVLLDAGGTTFFGPRWSRLALCDWDNDGVTDILSGFEDELGYPEAGVNFFHALGLLSIDENTLSRSAGGTIEFAIDGGALHAGRSYRLFCTASGIGPGLPLPGGATLPLNPDPVFRFVATHSHHPALVDFSGTLDGQGKALCFLNATRIPLDEDTVLHFAFSTAAPWDLQSNAASVEVVP